MNIDSALPIDDPTISSLIDEIARALLVIDSVDDINYRRNTNGTGSVGAQFRHNLDFITSLLQGIESGRLDYSDRERDIVVENDRQHARARFAVSVKRLSEVNPRLMGKSVLVRSEIEPKIWLPSSVAREVEFVHSHTVHHHALIGEKLAGYGIAAGTNFGVAPSTIEYWNRKAA